MTLPDNRRDAAGRGVDGPRLLEDLASITSRARVCAAVSMRELVYGQLCLDIGRAAAT